MISSLDPRFKFLPSIDRPQVFSKLALMVSEVMTENECADTPILKRLKLYLNYWTFPTRVKVMGKLPSHGRVALQGRRSLLTWPKVT